MSGTQARWLTFVAQPGNHKAHLDGLCAFHPTHSLPWTFRDSRVVILAFQRTVHHCPHSDLVSSEIRQRVALSQFTQSDAPNTISTITVGFFRKPFPPTHPTEPDKSQTREGSSFYRSPPPKKKPSCGSRAPVAFCVPQWINKTWLDLLCCYAFPNPLPQHPTLS